jgi:hypothetical protein
VEALVYDNRNLTEIKVYPVPDDSIIESEYTFDNPDGPIDFVGDEVFGVVTGIDNYTSDTVFGCLTDLYDSGITQELFNQVEGVVTAIGENAGIVRIWYIKVPAHLNTLEDDLSLPSLFDVALQHYITGRAFLDDLDSRYQQRGQEALTFYHRELDLAKTTETQDGVRSPKALTTTYRSPWE